MKECIITKIHNCPHKNISGKLCSSCTIPDIDMIKVKWYHIFYLKFDCFKNLSFDEQAQVVLDATECYHGLIKDVPGFSSLSDDEQKVIVFDNLDVPC